MGENNPFYGKNHTLDTLKLLKIAAQSRTNPPVVGLEVEITDLETKTTSTHTSIRKAAESINSDIKTILRRPLDMWNTPLLAELIICFEVLHN